MAFISEASNLLDGDTAADPNGVRGRRRFVAWSSTASNLVKDDSNGARTFMKSLSTGKTTCVSVTNTERQAKATPGWRTSRRRRLGRLQLVRCEPRRQRRQQPE